jgi:hypothetical protein
MDLPIGHDRIEALGEGLILAHEALHLGAELGHLLNFKLGSMAPNSYF